MTSLKAYLLLVHFAIHICIYKVFSRAYFWGVRSKQTKASYKLIWLKRARKEAQ